MVDWTVISVALQQGPVLVLDNNAVAPVLAPLGNLGELPAEPVSNDLQGIGLALPLVPTALLVSDAGDPQLVGHS